MAYENPILGAAPVTPTPGAPTQTAIPVNDLKTFAPLGWAGIFLDPPALEVALTDGRRFSVHPADAIACGLFEVETLNAEFRDRAKEYAAGIVAGKSPNAAFWGEAVERIEAEARHG
jgi:hypothetical protein